MKIMHLVLTPRYSGAEVLVRDLAISQVEMGHNVSVVGLSPSESSFEKEIKNIENLGVSVFLPDKNLRRIGRVLYIKKISSRENPDIIFAHSVIPAGYARLATFPQKKVISVLHSADNKNYTGRYSVASEKILSRVSAGVICVSDEGRDYYNKKFKPSAPVEVIKNGINVHGILSVISNSSRSKESDIRKILQIGRISPTKRQHLSIKAAAPILRGQQDIELWLAGLIEDSKYSEELKSLVESEGIARQVKFLGPRSDVFELLAEADLYLMPSLAEAHSVAMLEALASGVPIVCSDIPNFQMVRNYPGTMVLNPEILGDFSEEINKNVLDKKRFSRDLSFYSIKSTAESYVEFARRCLNV